MTVVDEFTVDRKEYHRRQAAKMRAKRARAVTNLRTGPWTDAEDAVVLRTDIFMVEKMAILQRSQNDIANRMARIVFGVEAECKSCGALFMAPLKVGVPRRYCSIACRGAARRLAPIACAHCQKVFKPVTVSVRFCSKSCADNSRRLPPIACAYCREMFTPWNGKVRFCSKPCRHASRRTLTPKPCDLCQKEFKPQTAASRFCSTQCGWSYLSVKPRKTHCKYGHEFTPENTVMVSNRNRKNKAQSCRTCQRRKADEANLRARERGRLSRTELQQARDARVVRWAELGKTWDALTVMAAEAGIDKIAMRDWLIKCGETVPDGRAHSPLRLRFDTHCRRGHERTPANTTIVRSGTHAGDRRCAVCLRENRERYKAAKLAAS